MRQRLEAFFGRMYVRWFGWTRGYKYEFIEHDAAMVYFPSGGRVNSLTNRKKRDLVPLREQLAGYAV